MMEFDVPILPWSIQLVFPLYVSFLGLSSQHERYIQLLRTSNPPITLLVLGLHIGVYRS